MPGAYDGMSHFGGSSRPRSGPIHPSVSRTYGGFYAKKTVHLVVVSAAPAMASGPAAPTDAAPTAGATRSAKTTQAGRAPIVRPNTPQNALRSVLHDGRSAFPVHRACGFGNSG